MTRRARFPHGAPPRAGAEDLKAWADLVAAAQAAAADPLSYGRAEALRKARNRTRRRTLPDGQWKVGSAFDQLIRFTDRWATMLLLQRREQAAGLAEIAGRCAAILEPCEPRSRADLEG